MPDPVTRISLGFVNAYLLAAKDGFVLVDTGMPRQWRGLEAALRGAGCAAGHLRLVVLTHADRDHTGNVGRLREDFGAPVAIHGADAPVLETGVSPIRTGRSFSARLAMRLIGMARRRARRRPPAALRVDVIRTDGQRLDDWGLSAAVVHLPGHTRGSIGVLTDGGDLIAGDTCVNRRRPGPSPFVESFADYRDSITRMREMAKSVARVFPGHGSPFAGSGLGGLAI